MIKKITAFKIIIFYRYINNISEEKLKKNIKIPDIRIDAKITDQLKSADSYSSPDSRKQRVHLRFIPIKSR